MGHDEQQAEIELRNLAFIEATRRVNRAAAKLHSLKRQHNVRSAVLASFQDELTYALLDRCGIDPERESRINCKSK